MWGIFMKLFLILSKRNLAVVLALCIILLLVISQAFSAKAKVINGSTNKIRTDYLNSIGINADDSNAFSKDIIIPASFDEVYKEYNSLQKKAGFDLSPYKGEAATVYTYNLSGVEDMQIHLIVCKGNIIGGDIASVKLDGEMKPLK